MDAMIKPRLSRDRGHANHGWLDSYFTFTFADYFDSRYTGFRQLRVINEDRVQPGTGFPTHSHRDMEILTYVLAGSVRHEDSGGNRSEVRAGDVQRMTAGSGIAHSEVNPSATEVLHLLQIWILPAAKGLAPGYEQRTFAREDKLNRLRLIATPDGSDGSLKIHQDARLYASILEPRKTVEHRPAEGRHAWLQVASGSLILNGVELSAGDGAAISGETRLLAEALTASEFLLFDLA